MALFYSSKEEKVLTNLNKSYKQPNCYYMTDVMGKNNGINSLSVNTFNQNLTKLGLISHSKVPESHKLVADSYMFMRKVFGSPVVHTPLSEEEKQLLTEFDFYPLEYTTARQMLEEIKFLKNWSLEGDLSLKKSSDRIIQTRSKELKHIMALNYVTVKKDLYDGYKVLEKYFQEISKYSRKG